MTYRIFKNANVVNSIHDFVIINTKDSTYTHELIHFKELEALKTVLDVQKLSNRESTKGLHYVNRFEFY